jgi:hypothetical protein
VHTISRSRIDVLIFHCRLKIKLKSRNFYTEHDFKDAFKILQKHWERFIRAEEDNFESDGSQ